MNKAIYHRRDPHPSIPGLFYWGMSSKKKRKPIWLTAAKLKLYRANQLRLTKKWQKDNPEKHGRNQKRFRAKHGKRRNAQSRGYRNRWKKMRRRSDPIFALKQRCSDRLRIFLGRLGWRKQRGVDSMIGCTYGRLKVHLESQFKPGMTWENAGYHGWHIDHKMPLATAKSVEDVYRLFHFKNLQPLWQKENLSKGARVPS